MNNIYVYGSSAGKIFFPKTFREPKDFDILVRPEYQTEALEKLKSITNLKIDSHWTSAFEYLDNFYGKRDREIYLYPNHLATIKLSHIPYNVGSIDKHIKDLGFYLTNNAKIDFEFLKLLRCDWDIIHRKKKVNLKGTNDEFFKPNIKREFSHDFLHDVLKFKEEPFHTKIRKDLSKPMCSKELWDKLSFEDQILCALEEIYVLTAERFLIPGLIKNVKIAKLKTMKNMVISTTSGWFCDFIIMNFEYLYRYSDEHFVYKLKNLGYNYEAV